MYVETVATPRAEDYFRIVDPPEGMSAKALEKLDLRSSRLAYVQNALGPAFSDLGTGNDQLSRGSKLFVVEVMLLGRGWACYSVALSHLVGDGATVSSGWCTCDVNEHHSGLDGEVK